MNPMIPSPHALQPSALAKLSLRDKLLLAQAVHEIGTSPPDWGRVSALLLAHPLIRQQSRLEQAANAGLTLGRIFGTRECERAWIALMRQRGLVLGKDEIPPEPVTPTTPKPKEARGLQPRTDRRSQLALAQLLYAERMEELKEQIKEKEEQFKNLVKEIDEIKSGKADARLEMELRIEMENLANGPPLPPSTPGSAAASVAGPATPASTASTTPKSAKAKGRPRGESAADLSKISPTRSDVTGTGSAPNSASKKPDSARSKKLGDRRASIDESPSKQVPGPTTLPALPAVTLPRPPTDAAASSTTASVSTNPNTLNADASNGVSATADEPKQVMTTEEAERAVADAATEAAVKVLQDETAASKVLDAEVEKAVEKVVETETNMELSAQAEGGSAAQAVPASAAASSSATPAAATTAAAETNKMTTIQPSTRSNEAPAAEVVVKEKEPVEVTSSKAAAPDADFTSSAAAAAAAGNKRKRDDQAAESQQPAGAAPVATTAEAEQAGAESPVKKARTAQAEKVPSSDEEMDSEDEAEAAVGVDDTGKSVDGDEPKDTGTKSSKDAQVDDQKPKAKGTATEENDDDSSDSDSDSGDEEEAIDQVKSVESPRKRTPAKEDGEAKGAADPNEGEGTTKEEPDASKDEDDDSDASSSSRKPASRRTPLRRRQSTTSRPAKPTPPPSSREAAAAKRKTAHLLSMLLTEVSNHTHGNLFHAPIKEQDAPDYYTLIKNPLDIKTIKARIKEGSIASAKQLRKALAGMFANSLIYNRPGTEVHRMASEMFAASEEIFKRYEGTQRF
ncbi:Nuclear protein STH1/NPS1 [Pseudozyma hubeiensis]|nr:Nuclear protein STH1/NPS1 [Pseudozyma hubeiensis]